MPQRKEVTVSYLPPGFLVEPVTAFWRVSGPGGTSTIKLELDTRLIGSRSEDLEAMLLAFWQTVWAPLISNRVTCSLFGVAQIFIGGPSVFFTRPGLNGDINEPASGLADSLLLVLYGGNLRPDTNRRVYVPYIPRSWHDGRVLTSEATGDVLTRTRGLFLGCDGGRGGPGPRLIIWHPEQVADRWNVARPAQFEDVQQVIACQYVDRAPIGT